MKVLSVVSLVLLTHEANAHGYLSQPAADFPNGIETKYNALLTESSDPAFAGLKWNDSPEANTAMFTRSFPNSRFKSLKALLDTAAPDCGNTVLTGSPVDVSSMGSMKWQNDQEHMGFIASHHGPCEAWIDDTKVFHSDDCRADYTGYPAEVPIDYSSCEGHCTFTFYWLAMHEANWQVYKQCAPIVNGSGTQGTATTTSSTPTTTPVVFASPTESPTTVPTTSMTTSASTNSPAFLAMNADAATVAPPIDSPVMTAATSCKSKSALRRRRMAANLRSEN
ncbi:hypothetical protein BBJ28_00018649 [Nothophytophthora sp. Chile5]|nr:hypothetical protein BBJ28_00018649 [Nothophytophthora sp. Chile5]